jgi:hypothetical protein
VTGHDGASGTSFTYYRLRLVSGPACQLRGWPRVTALHDGAALPVRFVAASGLAGDRWRGGVLVDRGHPADLTAWWSDWSWCAPPVTVTGLRLTLPGGSVLGAPGVGRVSGCDDPSDDPSARATIDIGRFLPANLRSAHRVSTWHAVHVDGNVETLTATAGSTVDLLVTLRARQDTPLDPCPDYTLTVAPVASAVIEETHRLNCAGVTTVDGDGVPHLPAGVPVTFDIRFVAPDSSAPKVIWLVRGPQLVLGAAAELTVTTPSPPASS